jgi:pyruvate formate lyase activating enzyme
VHCQFCQNWEISQSRPEDLPGEYAPPERIVELAARAKCPTIAYTYSEPTVWAEFAMDTADAAHRAGIRSIVISNGSMQAAAVREVYGRMDAIKIDLKSFSDSFYQKIVKGRLKPVLETIVTLREMNKWFEIVFLVIPTLNDSDAEFRDLARWIKNNAGPDIPLHFTQFHPAYKLKDLPVTPLATLERAHAIATGEGLRFVYIGNVAGHPAENTYCPECKQLLIERAGMAVAQWKMTDGACPQCQCSIPGIWS